MNPPPSALNLALAEFASYEVEDSDVLFVEPIEMGDALNFYVGDQVLISPFVTQGSACERAVIETTGELAYSRLRAPPRFIMAFIPADNFEVPDYTRIFSVATHRRFVEGSRPELNRHRFYEPAIDYGHIVLYEHQLSE